MSLQGGSFMHIVTTEQLTLADGFFLQFSNKAQWDILALVEPILGIQMHQRLLSKAYSVKLLI